MLTNTTQISATAQNKTETVPNGNFGFIKEIIPETINKLIFSDDLCKISFKVFTHDAEVEILYNPIDNTFNAYAIILFNLKNGIKSSDKLTVGNFPTDESIDEKLTVGKFPPVKNIDESDQKLRDNAKVIIKDWMRNKDNIEFIERVSLMLTGQNHFLYNDKPIWNSDGTIINELLDAKGRVQLNKLTHREDNIVKKINAGNSPISGTWLNFEFLPEMLRISNMNYRVLANHFQAILLPQLTNKSLSLEDHIKHQQRTSLLSQIRIDSIKTIQKANDKGKEAEKLVLESMREIFPDAKKTTHYHCCDIEASNGEILVEVKAVQTDVKADIDKFISDLILHQETVHIGIYINIFDIKHKTHYINTEYNFTIWFINPSDFTYELLNIIKQSNSHYNKEVMLKRKVNQQAKQIIFVKELQEELLDRLEKRWELHERALIARHNLSETTNKTMFMADAKITDKLNRDIQREKDLPKFNELVKMFIKLHYQDFKNGYHTKTCRLDIDEFIRNNGITSMGFDVIQNALNSVVYIDRHPTIPNGPHCYFFIDGLDEQFKPEETNLIEKSTTNDAIPKNSQSSPSMREIFELFINKPSISELLSTPGGCMQEHLSKRFKYYIQTQICSNDKTISHKRYTDEFTKFINEICIQVNRSGKRYYVLNNTDEANDILKLFDDCVNRELARDKTISYNEVKEIYHTTTQSNTLLTKLTMQPRFLQLRTKFLESQQ